MPETNPALSLFYSISSFTRLQELINDGEAEGQYLECKAPSTPRLNDGLKSQLAEAVSGFSNSGGGIIIWGMSTTKHSHSGLDVLTQITPLGNVKTFAQQIDLMIPRLTTPSVSTDKSWNKIIKESTRDTKGVIISYLPPTKGDPVQSTINREFYIRNGDAFNKMPYELLKRMFMGTEAPILVPKFDSRIVSLGNNGEWKIPIIVQNESSAAAKDTEVSIIIENRHVCQDIKADGFRDTSDVNPGKCVYMVRIRRPIHRGLNQLAGKIIVSMAKHRKLTRRILKIRVTIYSDKMRARRWHIKVQLAKKGFSVTKTKDEYLY